MASQLGSRFEGNTQTILLTVALQSTDSSVVETAISLAKQTKMHLRLIHVVEPWVGKYWASAVAGGVPVQSVVDTIEEDELKEAEAKIKVLEKQASSQSVSVSSRVVVGQTADTILADAIACGASLIVTGSNANYSHLVPRGFSTALSLMSYAQCPVLVIPHGLNFDFSKSLKCLVSDDLAPQTYVVLDTVVELLQALKSGEIEHVHVSSLDAEQFKQALVSSSASARSQNNYTATADEAWHALNTTIQNKLSERSSKSTKELDRYSIRYHSELLFGRVSDVLLEKSTKSNSHLLAFGKHASFHRKPFVIGKLPFHSMFVKGKMTLVVPVSA